MWLGANAYFYCCYLGNKSKIESGTNQMKRKFLQKRTLHTLYIYKVSVHCHLDFNANNICMSRCLWLLMINGREHTYTHTYHPSIHPFIHMFGMQKHLNATQISWRIIKESFDTHLNRLVHNHWKHFSKPKLWQLKILETA